MTLSSALTDTFHLSADPLNNIRHGWKRRSLTILGGLLLASLAQAQEGLKDFEGDFDDRLKPWQEITLQLPAAPVPENLMGFYVSPTATQEFAIDAPSITVGSDGVVRYTLVATSRHGAQSISYEGIRCDTFEKKLYAFGQADGSWSRSQRDQWQRISPGKANAQHARLAQDYFCENKSIAGNADTMRTRLQQQRPLTNTLYR